MLFPQDNRDLLLVSLWGPLGGATGCQKTLSQGETAHLGIVTKGFVGRERQTEPCTLREGKTKDVLPPLGVEIRLLGMPGQEGRHMPAASLVPDSPTGS